MRLQKNLFPSGLLKCFVRLGRVFEQWLRTRKENCSQVRSCYRLMKDLSNNIQRAVLENQAPASGNSAGLPRYYAVVAQMHFMVILYMEIEWIFRLSNYKMLLMSHFPFNMKRLKICQKMIQLLYIVCICICAFICPNVPHGETQKRINVCVWTYLKASLLVNQRLLKAASSPALHVLSF